MARRGGFKFDWQNIRFDSKKIDRHITKAEGQFLRHFGASVRMFARRSMRTKSSRTRSPGLIRVDGEPVKSYPASPPGKPPFAHSKGLKDAIRYAYNIRDKNVVIGPTPEGSKVAELIESGGSQTIRIYTEQDAAGRVIIGGPSKRAKVKFPARPYMQPAFKATQDKIEDLFDGKALTNAFKNSIRTKLNRAV